MSLSIQNTFSLDTDMSRPLLTITLQYSVIAYNFTKPRIFQHCHNIFWVIFPLVAPYIISDLVDSKETFDQEWILSRLNAWASQIFFKLYDHSIEHKN